MKFAVATLAALVAFVAPASAAAVQSRDVFTPKVLYPHTGTVWHKGEKHNVTWDLSHVPKQITNSDGFRIQLRVNDLISPFVLAEGFDPRSGHVEVTVPWVVEGKYSLVFFGDSGDYSDEFTILGGPAY